MGRRKMPERKDLVAYNHAVAGHAGTLCDPDGTLFVKPCTQQEIDFYDLAQDSHPEFYRWMPRRFGLLSLGAATDIADLNKQLGPTVAGLMTEHMKEEVVEYAHASHPTESTPPPTPAPAAAPAATTGWAPGKNRKLKTDLSIVLDNAAFGYVAPNIMDCKLGTRLWADDAPAEKKARFDKIASETTHRSHGFRIAGMRAYKGSENPADLDKEHYRKYDKDWGRLTVTPNNLVDSMRRFIFNAAAGVNDDDARFVCELFVEDLKAVEKMLSNEESRMYSASLLFVAEGDGEALALAIREAKAAAAVAAQAKRVMAEVGGRARKAAKTSAGSCPSWSNSHRVDSGIGMDDDELAEVEAEAIAFQDESPSSTEGESDSDAEEGDLRPQDRQIYSLRLIDFAHAEFVPGKGPDENILKGVRSLINIFTEMSEKGAKST
jgi:1D-myo-inositol-tetrakisphosphate 5-kinase/inositol-polyphosphate multikinase